MSKKIDPSKLKKGDVILTGVDDVNQSTPIKVGNLLRGRLNAIKWTHAAMSLGEFEIIESIPDPGIVVRNIQTAYIDKDEDILVLRSKDLTKKQKEEVSEYCISKLKDNGPYDNRALWYFPLYFINPCGLGRLIDSNFFWRIAFDRFINEKNAYFCSELLAEAFQNAGANFDFLKNRRPWQIMPVDFYNLKLFDQIVDIWA